MARIKRSGSKGVRRAAQSQSRAAGARRAKARGSGLIDTVMGVLPFTEQQWSRIFTTLIVVAALGVAAVIANMAGVPALAQTQLARFSTDAGFVVQSVRVSGTERMDEARVYAIALAEQDRAMSQVDPEELRARLLELPWVKDARVSIQLPDTISIDIVEREPHAVLVKPDHFTLIDIGGRELSPISREEAKGMLRVTGPGVGQRVAELEDLFKASPAIEAQVTQAEWVGNRRWNLTFESGQVLALPEGSERSTKALTDFARMDGQYRLIGGKVTSFDMRNPPRIFMREPGRADRVELAQGTP